MSSGRTLVLSRVRYQLVPRVSAVFSPFVHSTWRNHHHIPSLCASIQSPSFCTTYALADALRLFPLRFLMIAFILSSSFAVYVDAHTLVPFRFRWLMVIPSSTLRFRLVPQSRHTVYISYSFRKRLRRPFNNSITSPGFSSYNFISAWVHPLCPAFWLLLLLPLPFLPPPFVLHTLVKVFTRQSHVQYST